MFVVYAAQDPRTAILLPPGAASWSEKLLAAASLLTPRRLARYRNVRFRRYVSFLDRRTVGGHVLYLVLRKRFFDERARDAISSGARQVLVVGAGFDTLCLRLAPEYPGVRFIELDHPATHGSKKAAIAATGAGRDNLLLVPADLSRERLEDVLPRSTGWDGGAASLVMAEGLLMYLDPGAVGRFMDSVAAISPEGSRLVFSFLRADGKGRPVVGFLDRISRVWMAMAGEPLLWGVQAGSLPGFLAEHGLRLRLAPDTESLRGRYLSPAGLDDEPLGRVECLAEAEVAMAAGAP